MSKYAGDVSAQEAWFALKSNKESMLVDVRTLAEWNFVGIADLSSLNKEPIFLPWRLYPNMALNEQFASQLQNYIQDFDTPIYFICRSGGRSLDAAIAMAELGYNKCYNIDHGFEGPLNEYHHRSSKYGWKAENLPWKQG